MGANVAGIETADYEVVEVEPRRRVPDRAVQRRLGRAATPSARSASYGPEVVEACLAAGAHYIDTTGEQDWLITCDEQYGADFAAAGLLLSPGIAQMYTTGEIAAAALPGEARAWTPSTSRCSGAAARRSPRPRRSWSTRRSSGAHYLEQNQYVPWDPEAGPLPARPPRPARARARPALGRHLAPGLVHARTRGWPTSRRSAASSTRR